MEPSDGESAMDSGFLDARGPLARTLDASALGVSPAASESDPSAAASGDAVMPTESDSVAEAFNAGAAASNPFDAFDAFSPPAATRSSIATALSLPPPVTDAAPAISLGSPLISFSPVADAAVAESEEASSGTAAVTFPASSGAFDAAAVDDLLSFSPVAAPPLSSASSSLMDDFFSIAAAPPSSDADTSVAIASLAAAPLVAATLPLAGDVFVAPPLLSTPWDRDSFGGFGVEREVLDDAPRSAPSAFGELPDSGDALFEPVDTSADYTGPTTGDVADLRGAIPFETPQSPAHRPLKAVDTTRAEDPEVVGSVPATEDVPNEGVAVRVASPKSKLAERDVVATAESESDTTPVGAIVVPYDVKDEPSEAQHAYEASPVTDTLKSIGDREEKHPFDLEVDDELPVAFVDASLGSRTEHEVVEHITDENNSAEPEENCVSDQPVTLQTQCFERWEQHASPSEAATSRDGNPVDAEQVCAVEASTTTVDEYAKSDDNVMIAFSREQSVASTHVDAKVLSSASAEPVVEIAAVHGATEMVDNDPCSSRIVQPASNEPSPAGSADGSAFSFMSLPPPSPTRYAKEGAAYVDASSGNFDAATTEGARRKVQDSSDGFGIISSGEGAQDGRHEVEDDDMGGFGRLSLNPGGDDVTVESDDFSGTFESDDFGGFRQSLSAGDAGNDDAFGFRSFSGAGTSVVIDPDAGDDDFGDFAQSAEDANPGDDDFGDFSAPSSADWGSAAVSDVASHGFGSFAPAGTSQDWGAASTAPPQQSSWSSVSQPPRIVPLPTNLDLFFSDAFPASKGAVSSSLLENTSSSTGPLPVIAASSSFEKTKDGVAQKAFTASLQAYYSTVNAVAGAQPSFESEALRLKYLKYILTEKLNEASRHDGVFPHGSEKYRLFTSICESGHEENMRETLAALQDALFHSSVNEAMMRIAKQAALSAKAKIAEQAAQQQANSRGSLLATTKHFLSRSGGGHSKSSGSAHGPGGEKDRDSGSSASLGVLTPTGASVHKISRFSFQSGHESEQGHSSGYGSGEDTGSDVSGGEASSHSEGDFIGATNGAMSGPPSGGSQRGGTGLMRKFQDRLTSLSSTRHRSRVVSLRQMGQSSEDVRKMELNMDSINGGFDEVKWRCAVFLFETEEVAHLAPSQIKILSYPSNQLLTGKSDRSALSKFFKPGSVWSIDIGANSNSGVSVD